MRSRTPAELDPIELAVLCVLGFGLVAGLMVSVVGGVAGLLFGGGWVDLPLAGAPHVLARLPGELDDPLRSTRIGCRRHTRSSLRRCGSTSPPSNTSGMRLLTIARRPEPWPRTTTRRAIA